MLNNRQKSYLRGLANTHKSIVQVGKDGITYNLIQSLENALEAHELVKINLLKTCPQSVQEVAIDLAVETKSEVVQMIGRTIIYYRKSKESRIDLPR